MYAYVYVIQGEKLNAPLKIGVASNVKKRLKSLQIAHYEKLHVRCILTCVDEHSAYSVEGMLHDHYSSFRVRGEWFAVTLRTLTEDLESDLAVKLINTGVLCGIKISIKQAAYLKPAGQPERVRQKALAWLIARPYMQGSVVQKAAKVAGVCWTELILNNDQP